MQSGHDFTAAASFYFLMSSRVSWAQDALWQEPQVVL